MSERTKNLKERIDGLSKPAKNQSSALGVFLAILILPFLYLAFVGVMILAVWLIQNPLDTTAMFGISIALIGGYAVFLTPKRR